jgi:hypothetical protein
VAQNINISRDEIALAIEPGRLPFIKCRASWRFEEPSMTDTHFALDFEDSPDDLPRALRREREARLRAAPALPPPLSFGAVGARAPDGSGFGGFDASPRPMPAVGRSLDVSFVRLVLFFIKAIFAAIPAIFVLGAMLWFAGHLLQEYYPQLVRMQIVIRFSN